MDDSLKQILGMVNTESKPSEKLVAPIRKPAMDQGLRQVYKDNGIFLAEPLETGNDRLVNFHREALAVIGDMTNEVVRNASPLKDLKPELQAARMAMVCLTAQARMDGKLRELAAPFIDEARRWAGIVSKVLHPEPTDPMQAVNFTLRLNDSRNQIQGLGVGERIAAVQALAKAGDPRVPGLLNDSFPALLKPDMAEQAQGMYLENAVAPNDLVRAKMAGAAAREVGQILRFAYIAVDTAAATVGAPKAWRSILQTELVKVWPENVRDKFTVQYGADTYAGVLSGSIPLTKAVDLCLGLLNQ